MNEYEMARERTRRIIKLHSSDQLRRDDVWQIIEHVTALEEALREDAEFVHVIRHGDTEMEDALTFNRCDHEDCIARRELIGQGELIGQEEPLTAEQRQAARQELRKRVWPSAEAQGGNDA